tara:strand:- start:20272 stop:21423 length:1152 start_codon:yes stop_codon:yes gene_type:complete
MTELNLIFIWLTSISALLWIILLLQPWQPWRNQECLESDKTIKNNQKLMNSVTIIIPARNEEDVIEHTLKSLDRKGLPLKVLVVDDQSSDNTAHIIKNVSVKNIIIELITGKKLPTGWAGKMWALEQARKKVTSELILLMDADIQLEPYMLESLLKKRSDSGARLVSVMVALRMESFWEKLLMPAFVFFFKILYPFKLSNSRNQLVAAAAGGCILTDSNILDKIGGFGAIKNALIDDCALAREIKQSGETTWVGLTRSANSTRAYKTLNLIWNMIERSAFTQLRSSLSLLLLCTSIMIITFWIPVMCIIISPGIIPKLLGVFVISLMFIAYLPTLNYYHRSPIYGFAMPLIGTLYLLMTWSSAIKFWRGAQSNWKGRIYNRME